MWAFGPAFIIFLGGVLSSSIYLASYTYGQFEEGKDASVAPAPELYFDSEAKLLFDVNTGEVVKSFAGDERSLFFDTEATVLFDEDTGDIVYSEYFDKFISKKMKMKKRTMNDNFNFLPLVDGDPNDRTMFYHYGCGRGGGALGWRTNEHLTMDYWS